MKHLRKCAGQVSMQTEHMDSNMSFSNIDQLIEEAMHGLVFEYGYAKAWSIIAQKMLEYRPTYPGGHSGRDGLDES